MPTCARGCRLLPVFALLLAAMPRAAAAQTGTPTITVVATDSLASEVPTTSTAVAPSGSLVTSPVLSPIAAPVVGFGGGEFTIRLSQRSATALTVTFAVGGTARATSDYANVGVSVTVPAGATTFAIPVTVLDDKEVEPDETVVITLLAAAGYTVSSAPAVVTIVDADQAVELTATPHSLTEPASSTTVTVRRLGTLRGALVVRLAYSGSATRNTDYTAAADSVILLNGRSDATFPLTVRSDNSREGSETITVSATNVAMSQAPLSLAIADAARQMQQGAEALARTLAGQREQTTGTVRITTSMVAATYLLPPLLAELSQQEPGIRLELVASNQLTNLLRRDADIAVRMVRPEQTSLVARKLGNIGIGAYAHERYLQRAGTPREPGELKHHALIGYVNDDAIERGSAAFGAPLARDAFSVRTDDQVAYGRLVAEGAGIGFVAHYNVRHWPGVRRVLPMLAIPPLPCWLAVHREIRSSKVVRRVYDFLAEAVPRALDQVD